MNNQYIKNPYLQGEDFYWKGDQTGILLIHGYTATTAEVRLLAEKLHQAGYTTAGPLLPGHGTYPDDLNHAKWQMWLERAKRAYEELLRECDPIFVIGESMGALITLQLAAQHPEIAGIILSAPAIKIDRLWLARFLAPFKKYIAKPEKDDGLLWKGYTVDPIRGAAELYKLQLNTRQQLHKITQPTLVFTGEYDETIAPDSAKIVLNGIRSGMKCQIHMEESSHVILIDKELDRVFEIVVEFIERVKEQCPSSGG